MASDRTIRDLFPALVVGLERETSATPSVHDSDASFHPSQSPTPVNKQTLPAQDSIEVKAPTPIRFPPQLATGNESDRRPAPVRSTRIQFAPVEENSEHYLPATSHTVSYDSQGRKDASHIKGCYEKGTSRAHPRLGHCFRVVKKATPKGRAEGRPNEATPTSTPRVRIVVRKRSREITEDSDTVSDPTSAKGTKDVTPIPSHSSQDSIHSTAPSDPRNPSSYLESNLLNSAEETPVDSNMDSPKPTALSTSQESSSDYDETLISVNPTSELPATSMSPNSRSSSEEAPSRDAGHLSPTLDFVPSTPPHPSSDSSMGPSTDPSMDPNMVSHRQPLDSAVMPGNPSFEDPNVLPSTFMYPEETFDQSNWAIDPMGVYTPEEYARILASEQEVLREMADPHTDIATHLYSQTEDPYYTTINDLNRRTDTSTHLYSQTEEPHHTAIDDLDRHTDISTHPYSQTEEPHYTTIDDMDRIFAEMEAATAGMDFLQPEFWAAIGRDLSSPSQPGALESDQHAQAPTISGTLQSVEETDLGSVPKRARHSSPKTKSPSPDLSSTLSVKTSVSMPSRSASSKAKSTTPPAMSASNRRRSKDQSVTPAPTASSSRRRSKASTKTETATPEPRATVTVSPRRLRSSDVMPRPSTNTKKNPQGNATPDSWETAPTADKMMSQMKETESMSWFDITAAWNQNRSDLDDEMTWRALSKRWGRIKDRIGPWPGFDEALLDAFSQFNSKPDDESFAQIAEDISIQLGWDVSGAACQGRYDVLEEAGKIDLKGKGRARK
ncbi:hypothetical protein N7489_002253 [Penicillium chrysogenum]|uniref:uncharacterized protein n=1 Tax=Penicillium chrysogenum TaxID=5076 RepID=UPI0024DF0C53|nr:uncharacterized protein N7489_002253 [Penicillium chrysogenum]KAJ5251843.1 hypothetical protein N7489_002253 [Penicillium chrysogenum]